MVSTFIYRYLDVGLYSSNLVFQNLVCVRCPRTNVVVVCYLLIVNLWFYKIMSTLGALYRKIIFNNETCIQFLKDRELLT